MRELPLPCVFRLVRGHESIIIILIIMMMIMIMIIITIADVQLPAECMQWDTYFAEEDGFAVFHQYVCAAFLETFSKSLLDCHDFQVHINQSHQSITSINSTTFIQSSDLISPLISDAVDSYARAKAAHRAVDGP